MNDFSELELELRKLRPAQASSEMAARIERALEEQPNGVATAAVWRPARRFQINWLSLGIGLAAAGLFLLLARVHLLDRPAKKPQVAAVMPAPAGNPVASDAFVPSGLTQVVYDTRDEGLMFAGAAEPVRRVRSRSREILRWKNPRTGESLRVSYPSEEVRFIPATGQ